MILERAKPEDIGYFFRLKNDPTAVRFSESKREVSWPEHEKWFCSAICDETQALYVAKQPDGPVGTARVEKKGTLGIISIVVDRNRRGNGYGSEMVRQLVESIQQNGLTPVARIKSDNVASMIVFLRAGMRPAEDWLDFTL